MVTEGRALFTFGGRIWWLIGGGTGEPPGLLGRACILTRVVGTRRCARMKIHQVKHLYFVPLTDELGEVGMR